MQSQGKNARERWASLAVELKKKRSGVNVDQIERDIRATGAIKIVCERVLDVVMPTLHMLCEENKRLLEENEQYAQFTNAALWASTHNGTGSAAPARVAPPSTKSTAVASVSAAQSASSSQERQLVGPPADTTTPPLCPNAKVCGETRPMQLKTAQNGQFWACRNPRFSWHGCWTLQAGRTGGGGKSATIYDSEAPIAAECKVPMILRCKTSDGTLFYGCPNFGRKRCGCGTVNLTAEWKCPRGAVKKNSHGCVLRAADIPSVELPTCETCLETKHILRHNRVYVLRCTCNGNDHSK